MQELIRTLDHHEEDESYYQVATIKGNEKTTYNISDYRTSCRTCKDMDVDEFDTLTSKKTYKKGSLMNVPNTGFTRVGSKLGSSIAMKKVKPSIDIDKARKLIADAKGKVAQMKRYSVPQLKKMSLDQLIKLILLLQDENDRLRAELEKLRIKVQVSDKKGQPLGQLKATLRQNKASLDQARQSLKDGYRLIQLISQLVDEILQAFRLPASQQQIRLQPLLRKLKVLLEGHYQPASKTHRGASTGSIRDQFEGLISHLGFEAHKSEAVLADNNENEQKNIDEYYDSMKQHLDDQKDAFQDHIKKQNHQEIKDLRDNEMNTLRQLEQYQQRIGSLEKELEDMNELVRTLRVQIEQEKFKITELTIAGRQQGEKIEQLNQTVKDKDNLIEEFRSKLNMEVNENATLMEENKRILAEHIELRKRIEELRPLEQLSLDRAGIQSRLDYIKEQEEQLKVKLEKFENQQDDVRKIKESNRSLQRLKEDQQ